MKPGIFVGLTCLDLIYYQEGFPPENLKSKTNNYSQTVGGPVANAAITYALLGGKAVLITCIGDSSMGKIIKQELEDYGVEIIDFAAETDILPSIGSISVNTLNGSRTVWSGQQIFKINMDTDISTIIGKAKFCLFDCNLPEVSTKVLQYAKNEVRPIVLDSGSWRDNFELFLSAADDVIVSFECRNSNNDEFLEIASQYGVKNAAVTNGENLIRWKSALEEGTIMPPQVQAKDTLAAGDIYHGAYCYFKFEENLSFYDSLVKASEVAAMSVQYLGPREGVKEYKKMD